MTLILPRDECFMDAVFSHMTHSPLSLASCPLLSSPCFFPLSTTYQIVSSIRSVLCAVQGTLEEGLRFGPSLQEFVVHRQEASPPM